LRHFLEILNSLLQASLWLSLQVLIHSYSYLNVLPQKCLEEKVSHEKWLASASGNGAGRDDKSEEEAEEGADGDDGEEEEEVFDVKEINPPNYVDMGHLVFRAPTNPTWRVKVSYKGKTESVRENRRILARTQPRDAYDYRFHSRFQQDFYASVIMTKSKLVVNSQWIDWAYMENKHDPIFDGVIAACQVKHLRDILAFKKD
jgi:hypothetical protein